MPRRMWILSLAICLAGYANPLRAGVVISIESTTVAVGGSATLNVFISGGSPGGDLINNYGFQLQITNNGGDNTQLAFTPSPGFGYLTNTGLNPHYLFLGDSLAASPPATPAGFSTTTMYPADSWVGFDAAASGNPVTISTGQTFLLASLVLTASTGAPPMDGDSFTISLVPDSGDGSINTNALTFFNTVDSNFDQTSHTAFTSTSGTITMGTAAVPEPPSIVMGLAGLLAVTGLRGVLRRGAESQVA